MSKLEEGASNSVHGGVGKEEGRMWAAAKSGRERAEAAGMKRRVRAERIQ